MTHKSIGTPKSLKISGKPSAAGSQNPAQIGRLQSSLHYTKDSGEMDFLLGLKAARNFHHGEACHLG
jgi:hypothetical protein